MADIFNGIRHSCRNPIPELPRRLIHEKHFIVGDRDDLTALAQWLFANEYYLCTLVACDERMGEDNIFKLYYVFSSPEGEMVILENPLSHPQFPTQFFSLRGIFPSLIPLEREIFDLYGLTPSNKELKGEGGRVLHASYPEKIYPLRRSRVGEDLKRIFESGKPHPAEGTLELPEGMLTVPVGPIHAGIIEAGQFIFHVAGEVIEEVDINLGYKHRGIEKLFETDYTLKDGWRLAEKVAGDSAFAHSLAYCQAVEALAGVTIPTAAQSWRGVFLELERIYNHIGDTSALLHDIALDIFAAPLAVEREALLRLNHRLCGNRLLSGVNRPGGVVLNGQIRLDDLTSLLKDVTDEYLSLSRLVLELQSCRERYIGVGVLTEKEALQLGTSGFAARASGLVTARDFRLRCPTGIYRDQTISHFVHATLTREGEVDRRIALTRTDLRGDVFSRLQFRMAEVETSVEIIKHLAGLLRHVADEELLIGMDFALSNVPVFEYALGYAEGWRGDVCYWVAKGANNTIFRCKVRDPSLFNWLALRQAVIRKPKENVTDQHWENILADFPVINKSFNLSYAGNDL
jgi:Ni,Fe-hydrogenase III large subunit/Ni,Fe-hydrogenase III component G